MEHPVAWRVNSHKYRSPGSPNEHLRRRLDRTCKGSWDSLAKAEAEAEAGTPHNASTIGVLTFLCALACLRMLVAWSDGCDKSRGDGGRKEGVAYRICRRARLAKRIYLGY